MRVSSVTMGGDLGVVTSSSDPYITSFVGPYADLRGCATCGILDRPYRQDISGLPLAKQIGHVMGVSRLANATPSDKPNIVVVRATNLSTLTAAVLLKMRENERQKMLESFGGIAWTTKLLRFAGKMPGMIGISDGVRFALAMYFLIGIADSERGKDSDDAKAYQAFAKLFKDAEAELTRQAMDEGNSLSGLGIGPRSFPYSKDTAASKPAPPKQPSKKEAASVPAQPQFETCQWFDVQCHARNAAKGVVQATKAVGDGIQGAADFATDIICKGLKGLLGDAIGGAICWVITKAVQIFVSASKALVEIVGTAIEGLLDFVRYLAAGKPMEAIKALLGAVTKMVFLLFLPISEPFMGVKAAKLKEIGDKVAKKNPFFPLSLIFGIIGVLQPTPSSISTLILALSPAVAVLVAPALYKMLKLTLDKCEEAVEKFLKLALIIFQGAMALADILPRLKTSVAKFLEKRKTDGVFSGKKAGDTMQKFKDLWGKITKAFSEFKLTEISGILSTLFALAPEILGGLLEDVNTEIPEIGESIKAIQDAPKSIEEKEQALQKFNEDCLKAMGLERRRQVVMEQASKLQSNEAGLLTGRLIAERFAKAASPAEKQAFLNATRQEFNRLAPQS